MYEVGLRVERRHHLQSVCLQDVDLVDQTDENSLRLSQPRLSPKRFSSDDDDGDAKGSTRSPIVDETATQRILCS
ncbi:hypothetical protein AVEN_103226-1 [Araneus ventricosus]|uniref:Uncharacterized protein n=1 Tax=Araneus ventricosus TaxID=182803 RepID=A0A4Y2F817_ARAVE|nr:hypothetical protein AVEN_103226-1 [Araneus ventricosus]